MAFNPRSEQSEITFGFYDPARYVPETLNWHPVNNKVFWSLNLDDVRLGSESLGLCGPNGLKQNCSITPDSGTSQMTFPDWAFDEFRRVKHPKMNRPFNCVDEFEHEDLIFVIDKVEYVVPSHHWVKIILEIDAPENEEQICESKVKPLSIPNNDNENLFILGNTFMQLYYSIFDRDEDKVGFAEALHHDNEVVIEYDSLGELAAMVEITPAGNNAKLESELTDHDLGLDGSDFD